MMTVELPLKQLREATWNSNQMDKGMLARLRESIRRYGLVENLVVRRIVSEDIYEVLSGNQRLQLIREKGFTHAPCVVVDLDDAHARLLSQALNYIHGEDDLGLRAELLRNVLETATEDEVAAILPETADSLKAIASMGQETIATHLQNWQQARAARLKHLQFQLTQSQLEVVEQALGLQMKRAYREKGDSPNIRGTALYLLCKKFIDEVNRK